MFAYLNRKLGNISVAAKLALGFAVVLLLTLATTISGWRALDDAIVRSQQLSEIGLINDLTKDLRAERITYRVLNDDTSKARISSILEQLNNMLTTLQKRSNVDESRQLLTEKLALLQRLRGDFSELQRSTGNRSTLREAMQAREQALNDAIDELQTQALLRMPADSQQSGVLGLMDTLTRQVEGANQQSLVPAYTFTPVEDFAKVGDNAWMLPKIALGNCLPALRRWVCHAQSASSPVSSWPSTAPPWTSTATPPYVSSSCRTIWKIWAMSCARSASNWVNARSNNVTAKPWPHARC